MSGFRSCEGKSRAGSDGVRETMHRYTYPVPRPLPVREPVSGGQTRTLELLLEQNQLLSDLLGAVNALTAAVLALQCRPENLTER